ncbi:Protein kinase-like domain protein [Metarhizium album ARSEF 1941]|uniref:Protein kinase-like domain protein n=1 Tax=Metarhizium album (strain ARSEF 1941) TaxID=1081103 RepID=A0A0B2WEV9_METAS|nr:Protein kinase-like domain protein [Metarhizium album ARSEF 1941]KHN94411.1 Protein kinase-like domain protein [Metarhizium album ARSEF 1941]
MDTAGLPRHLQNMRTSFVKAQAQFPMEDKFPPTLAPEDGPIIAQLNMYYISYYVTERVFVKRQPHQDEMGLDVHGSPVVVSYVADRLRNEAAVLDFVAAQTKIPVPKLLRVWEQNGLVHLKTEFIGHGVGLDDIGKADLPKALEVVSAQLRQDILPQLDRIPHQPRMGSPDATLPLIPPHWMWDCKENRGAVCRSQDVCTQSTDEVGISCILRLD